MSIGWQAFGWGGFAGLALLLGAVLGYLLKLRQAVVAGIMAFGSGVLISALSFELMDEAFQKGGFWYTAMGFVLGAVIYSGANFLVSRYGAKHRKRSTLPAGAEAGSGLSIAIGSLIDGIPESIVIGLGMIEGGAVSLVAVAAVFLSNIPEGLSSSVGMRKSGKRFGYVALVWGGIAFISAVSSFLGYWAFQDMPLQVVSAIMATAAGAILAMIVDTMIPEAFEGSHDFAGLITVAGFLCAFLLDRL